MKYFNLYVLFLVVMLNVACSKKDGSVNYKPQPSAFTAQAETSSTASAAASTLNLLVKAGTNGWWVDIPATAPWCTTTKKYGSGDFTVPLKLAANTSGLDRKVDVVIRPTFNIQPVTITIVQMK